MGELKYLRNLAMSLMGQVGVADGWFGEHPAQTLYELYGEAVHAQLHRMRPETLGRIAALGKSWYGDEGEPESWKGRTALYVVHCGTYLDKHRSGLSLLREIACTAIIAEMADILTHHSRAKPAA